jgi:hypothetical protein
MNIPIQVNLFGLLDDEHKCTHLHWLCMRRLKKLSTIASVLEMTTKERYNLEQQTPTVQT